MFTKHDYDDFRFGAFVFGLMLLAVALLATFLPMTAKAELADEPTQPAVKWSDELRDVIGRRDRPAARDAVACPRGTRAYEQRAALTPTPPPIDIGPGVFTFSTRASALPWNRYPTSPFGLRGTRAPRKSL